MNRPAFTPSVVAATLLSLSVANAGVHVDLTGRVPAAVQPSAEGKAQAEAVAELAKRLTDAGSLIRQQKWDDALVALSALASDCKDTPVASLCEIQRGWVLHQKGEKATAAELLKKHAGTGGRLSAVASAVLAQVRSTHLGLEGELVRRPGQKIEFRCYAHNVQEVGCALFAIDLARRAREYRYCQDPIARKPLRTWRTKTADGWATIEVADMPPGAYLLEVEADGVRSSQPFLVTDVVVSAYSLGDRRYVLVHGKDGAVPESASATFVDGVAEPVTVELDADGVVELECPWAVLAVVDSKAGPGVVHVPVAPAAGERARRLIRCYTYADRAVYRPGETVHFRGVIRNVVDGRFSVPEEPRVDVRLLDPGGRLVAQRELELSSLGTFHDSFEIGERCKLGDFRIETRLLPTPEGVGQDCARTYFAVEAYRRPDIGISVVPARDMIAPGESVKVDLQATYFHRTPVAGARLTWRIEGSGAGGVTSPRYGSGVETDKDGRANFTICTRAGAESGELLITVQLHAPSRRVYAGRAEIALTANARSQAEAGARPGVETDRAVYFPGDVCRMTVRAPTDCARGIMLVSASGFEEAMTFALQEGVAELALPIRARHVGGLVAHVECPRGHGSWQARQPIRVQPAGSELSLTVEPDRDDYVPGDEANVLVKCLDRDGEPVHAEVGIGLVDTALYAVAEETLTPIETFFHPPRTGGATRAVPQMVLSGHYSPWGMTDQQLQMPYAQTINAPAQFDVGLPFVNLMMMGAQGGQMTANVDDAQEYGLSISAVSSPRGWLYDLIRAPWAGAATSVSYLLAQQQKRQMAQPMPQPPRATASPPVPAVAYEGNLRMGRSAQVFGHVRMGKGGLGSIDVSAVEARMRTFFPGSAAWIPTIRTDRDGRGTVRLTLPDTITSWRFTGRAVGPGAAFAQQRCEVRTGQELFFTCERPRILREGDRSMLSVLVHADRRAGGMANVQVGGLDLVGMPDQAYDCDGLRPDRLDWHVRAPQPGRAMVQVRDSQGRDALSDAFEVLPAGLQLTFSCVVTAGEETVFQLPDDYDPDRWNLCYRWMAGMSRIVTAAKEKLVQFPHGCVEQTVSRFMPDVIVMQTLKWRQSDKELQTKLADMVAKGAQTLCGYQNNDGGWGWFREERSDPFMSGYVLWGLSTAAKCGYVIDRGVLCRGRDAALQLASADAHADVRAFLAHAISAADSLEDVSGPMVVTVPAEETSPVGAAFMALACDLRNEAGRAAPYISRLKSSIVSDGGRAYWATDPVSARALRLNTVEVTAAALRALLRVEGESDMAKRAGAWLSLQCCADAWQNTKSSAAAVYALAEYLRIVPEGGRASSADLLINGERTATIVDAGKDAPIRPRALRAGRNTLKVTGAMAPENGVLLVVAEGWTAAGKIEAGGTAGRLSRVFRTFDETSEAARYPGDHTKREPGKETDRARSGQQIEVELVLDTSRELSHLVLEDPIPAGCEFVDMSWDPYGGLQPWRRRNMPFVYAEPRDDRMTFFLRHLPAGKCRIVYRIRGETPGIYRVPPATVHDMYEPTTSAHSTNAVMEVTP